MIYAINMPAWIYILARTTANFGIFTTRAQFQPLFRPTHFLKPRWIKKRFHCLYRFRNSTSVIGTKWEERVTLTWLSVLFLLASLCSVLSAFCTGFFWGGRGLQIKYILGIAISNNSGIYTYLITRMKTLRPWKCHVSMACLDFGGKRCWHRMFCALRHQAIMLVKLKKLKYSITDKRSTYTSHLIHTTECW